MALEKLLKLNRKIYNIVVKCLTDADNLMLLEDQRQLQKQQLENWRKVTKILIKYLSQKCFKERQLKNASRTVK